jgi:hypothetical protein
MYLDVHAQAQICCHLADSISASSDRRSMYPCRSAALTSMDTPLPSRLIVRVPSGTTVENVSPLNCKPGRAASRGKANKQQKRSRSSSERLLSSLHDHASTVPHAARHHRMCK